MAVRNASSLIAEEGRFQILSIIGRGAYSVVYRAYDRETRAEVALKTLDGWSPHEIYRLKREFRILRTLRHPSLVEIYELFSSSSGGTFFSMELVDGLPLLPERFGDSQPQHEVTNPPLDPQQCTDLLSVTRDLVDALILVHAAGIVHRDVKPSNVLWRSAGGLVLLDFGLAAYRDPDGIDGLIERGPAGTWVYMAPEAILGRPPTPACDWYSLAVLLLEAITGSPAFIGTAAEVWQAKQRGLSSAHEATGGLVPDALAELIVASLHPDPARRPDGECWRHTFSQLQRGERKTSVGHAGLGAELAAASSFFGREDELQELAALYRQATRGQTVVAAVVGPGGIGKTELVRHFLRQVPLREPPLVFRARCHWQESVPFNALDGIVDELGLWLASQKESPLDGLTVLQKSCLSRMFPVLAEGEDSAHDKGALSGLQPREVRQVAFEALRLLLTQLADKSPLVLWIDDAQWADADSAVLLSTLFRPPAAPRAMIILCYRSEHPVSSLPLLDDPSLRPWADTVRSIPLAPLPSEVARQLAAQSSRNLALKPALLEQVVQEAEGSPLLVRQLAQHAATCEGADLSPSFSLPDVLSVRVQALPPAARRILDLTAVAVRPIARSLLLRIAGVGESGRALVSLLDAAHLLHSSRVGERVLVEPYHQRIGEALRGRLSLTETERCHVMLAAFLATEANVEEERVFHHWRAAGRLPEAAEWAIRAADRAARQLAFERAAELYAEALALGLGGNASQGIEIEKKRAEMLVNAGRGAAAAPVFLALAQQTPDAVLAGDLHRRAAEEYLMSGHLVEGTAALRCVLGHLGLAIPRSPTTALLRSLVRVLPLWWRERRARIRGEMGPSVAGAQARCDACHAAAKGLSFVDPPRGLYFSLHALRWALMSGHPQRLARSLSFVGSNLLPMGGVFSRWATHMIERAGAIARVTDDGYLAGVTALAIAQMRMMECRWMDMLALCDHARDEFRNRCHGVAWEVSVATMAALRALEELGKLNELYSQAVAMVQEASRTGNLYAEVTGLLYEGFYLLAAGDSSAARRLAEESGERWKTKAFHVQHFYAARLASLCDLYEGNAVGGVERFEPCWQALQQSGLVRHGIFRVDALILRGRLTLAQLARLHGEAVPLRREVARVIKELEREGRADASGWALVFRAAVAVSAGKGNKSVELLTGAQQKFESANMLLAAAVAGHCASRLCEGPLCEKLARQAEQVFASAGVAAPARFVDTLAPGFTPGFSGT